jgi:superfamily II DNA or RNA helicase
VIQEFPAAYRYGLTATLDRADGLTPAMLAIMGPVIHTIPQSAVPTITPGLRIIPTYYKAAGADYSAIMEDLIQSPERNRIILDAIKDDIDSSYTLVLSDRIEHLEILAANLAEECPQVKAAVITGQLGKKERQRIMEETVGKEIRVLFATQLAREGLDIPHLDRLFMVTPKRARGAVQQEVGRIMRPCDGKKTAVVIDFLDNNGMLIAQFKERKKVYRELGMME